VSRPPHQVPAWVVPAVVVAGLVLLAGWSAWHRYAFLTTSPYPMGIDGYFYPIQLRSILEHGTLEYPSSPLAFYLMAPFAAATDPITGAKLGAAIGGALIAFPAYGVGRQLGGNRAAGAAAAVLATTSAGSFYLSVEFVKNGWGLTVALGAIWLALRAIAAPTRRRLVLAAAGVVAAALTHKMAVGLVAAIAGPAAVVAIVRARPSRSRAWLVRVGAGAGALLAVGIALALVAPERFVAGRDLGQLGALFTRDAQWSAPALFLDGGRFVLALGHEGRDAGILGLAGGAVLVAVLLLRGRTWWPAVERTPAVTAAAIAACALGVFVALPWIDVTDPQGLGFRLRIAAFVPWALAAAVVAGQAAAFVAAEIERQRNPFGPLAGLMVAGALAIVFVRAQPTQRNDGVVRAHPAMVAATQALAGAVPTGDTIVISERHTLYMAAYYARIPIVLRPETVPPDRRWRLMPLAFIGRETSLYRLLLSARRTPGVAPPRGFHPRDPNGLVLVPEPTWTWILDRLPPGPQRHYRAWRTI
jgi:hypothetical protein